MYDFYLNDFFTWLADFLDREKIYPKDLNDETVRKYRLFLNRRKSAQSEDGYKRSTQKTFMVAVRAFLKYLIVERNLDVVSPD